MADPQDPFNLNVIGVTDLLQNPTNKLKGGVESSPEGVQGEKKGVLDLDINDKELLLLRDRWESQYASYEKKIKARFEANLESYLGRKKDGQWLVSDGVSAANLQFEAEETFLAAALAKNPEPVVYADNTEQGNLLADQTRTMLAFHADQLALRPKMAVMTRQWSIYLLGVLKHGWDDVRKDISLENRKIQDFVFDPNGYVDAYGDFTSYLGERITVTADKLIELFPKFKAEISDSVEGNLGTEVVYTEWWDDKITFCTYKGIVLDKAKNPNFLYEEEGDESTLPKNHFAVPKKPYTFLSVFSLQENPHDITSLLEQGIPNQKLITKRTEQIDYNISRQNNSDAFSENNFNQETAKQAANALKKGNPILVPAGGPIGEAIARLPAEGLPQTVFASLETNKNDLRSLWGVQGIVSQPQDEDQTARGMILNQAHDTTRIGGGIGQALERVAASVFNWWVQLYYVFYDEDHFAAIMGNAKAVEYVTFNKLNLTKQLVVSVAPDSLKPKDQVTNINLAQALFDKGAIGPKTLLKMVDFPNVEEAAADGVLYKLDPAAYLKLNFPDFAAKIAAAQSAVQPAPGMDGIPPEATTEPSQPLSSEPASAALNQVALPPL